MPQKTNEVETPADLTAWAKGVAAAVTPAELARLVKDYREQSRNPRRGEVAASHRRRTQRPRLRNPTRQAVEPDASPPRVAT